MRKASFGRNSNLPFCLLLFLSNESRSIMKNLFVPTLILAFFLSAGCSSSTPAPGSTATATRSVETSTALPTATLASTEAVETPGIPEFPRYGNADIAGPEIPSGNYKTPDWFSIPLNFTTSREFRGIGEQDRTGELFGLVVGTSRVFPMELVFFSVDRRINLSSALDRLRRTPNADIEPEQFTEVAGHSATQLDLLARPNPAQQAAPGTPAGGIAIPAIALFVGHAGGDWNTGPEAHIRCILLDVDDRVLLIYIEAPKAEFESFMTDVNDVLAALEFSTR